MDSINQQQPEDNLKNLRGAEATKKMKELAENAATCFFCSSIKTGVPFSTRPMTVLKVDDDGNFWFLSSDDSFKNEELSHDPFVHLLFQGSAYSDFLNIYGIAEISKDKEKIRELWNPMLKTWFTEGEDDSRITVIKVDPSEGYYWDHKNGKAVAFIKQAAGAVLGKTYDDTIEGKLDIE
ncbi:general stress protein 26 [Arcticibacter tournemirensis]|uniref:Pyridoxamine 5'-phosphate oxidase family protein n=1 Tax=Arcticibacter tournemirensis TaxID=699437 RepID=A0A5M9H7M0_9SPHI|nr:pyridoxamine 5'-phosphate oxidase family protein [Arcticibacter tournemirensis]KAA8482886.1 pyridoxamine 5'-phosphate oxidase family protein [Arcticibacter tournemirensis]TQM49733.1 general stress protein 26 [Arcticibacter tournemirensis]